MSDRLFESFITECKEIAGGLDRLNSKWLKSHKDSFLNRYVVKDELDYRLYLYQSAYSE